MRRVVFAFVLSSVTSFAVAQAKVENLAKPPANAEKFTIMSTAGVHGHFARWTGPDGARYGRERLLLRGQVSETDSVVRLGKDGMIEHLVISGFTPSGDSAETFDIKNGMASWKTPIDAGSVKYQQSGEV